MKTYIFTLSLYHEKFNGYDSYDGNREVEILARNEDSARNKLAKLIKNYTTSGRWYNIISIRVI
jgi:hypothetical protein